MHWFVCQIHANELNLRAVFQKLDGATTGPRSFSGPLGRAANGAVHRRPVVEFSPVAGPLPQLPEAMLDDLSTDQRLLLKLAKAVQMGVISEDVACLKIGPLNHARYDAR